MKRYNSLFFALILGALLVVLAACGGGGSTEKEDEGSTDNGSDAVDTETEGEDEAVELSGEIEFMTISLRPAFDDYLDGLKADFEDMHPNVTVKINDVPFEQVEQIVLTSASSGNLPDVMNLNTNFVKKIGHLGALVDMNVEGADVKDDFFEGIWGTGEVGDGVYALPWYTTTSGMIYNPDILEAAGFDGPPITYKEAWDMSKQIYEKTGAYGQVLSTEFFHWFPKNGISYLNEENTAAAFNTPEAVELWTMYKELYDEGLIPIDVMLGQTSMPELYAQEKVAWWATGPQLFRQVKDLSPEVYDKSLASTALLGEAGVQHANPMNIAVSENSKSREAAIAFAKFVTNAENQLAFAKEANVLPPVIEAANDEYFNEGEDAEDVAEAGAYHAAQALADAINIIPPVENVGEIYKALKDALTQVLLEDKDVQEALDEAEERVNQAL